MTDKTDPETWLPIDTAPTGVILETRNAHGERDRAIWRVYDPPRQHVTTGEMLDGEWDAEFGHAPFVEWRPLP